MIIHGNLNQDWPWVRPGIEEIRRRNNATWLAEDLYCQVKTGQASLYVNEERNSFAIAKPISDPYTGEHGAELLAVFLKEDRLNLQDEFFAILFNAGARFLQTDSKRKGFGKIGWEVEKIVYRRRL